MNDVIFDVNCVIHSDISALIFEASNIHFPDKWNSMKTNEDLQRDVQEAIKWEPLLNAAEIGVTAKDGLITLTGIVNSFAKKAEAEDAAKSVAGVKAINEKIEIRIGSSVKKGDDEIAKQILNVFKWSWEFPCDSFSIKVENGWVTLEGNVHWNYQKEAVKESISTLIGIKGICNNIKIVAETPDEVKEKDIESALSRNWTIDDRNIKIKVLGNKVMLNGTVRSLYQKHQVGSIAWKASGISIVENDLIVEFNDLG